MNIYRYVATILLACVPLLSACHEPTQSPTTNAAGKANHSTAARTAIGRTVQTAMKEARADLATENISISDDNDANLPKAEISPQGALLIDGKPVIANAQQKTMLLSYRARLTEIAEAGMDIGAQGANLAGKAVGEAIGSVFSGHTDQVEQHVEAEAEKIKASAKKLCDLMPALLDQQQKLALAMPAFRPYAAMNEQDILECYKDSNQ